MNPRMAADHGIRPGPGSRPPAVVRALSFIRDSRRDRFEDVALEVFAFQFGHNPPYRRLCERRGLRDPDLDTWELIPFVPAAAFQSALLTSWFPERGSATTEPERVFLTSGTSRGQEGRGRHALPELALYRAAWEEPFRRHLLPDRERILMLSLIPGEDVLPQSSLSYMVSRILERFSAPGSRVLLDRQGLDAASFERSLAEVVERREAVLLLGTGLGMLAALDSLENGGRRFRLPEGSRILDTGGFKGRAREVRREDLLARYAELLGIPRTHVVGEYGMTELSSQFYEPTLREHVEGTPTGEPRIYVAPPWARTRVLDPETLRPLPPGATGLLAHMDLANAWTVSAVLTEDIGFLHHEGFVLEGRARAAELRGCSLATEELLRD